MDAPSGFSISAQARRRRRRVAMGVVALLILLTQPPAGALVINFDAPGISNASALSAMERAADAWEALFTDSVQVNISASLLSLGQPQVLGQTSSVVLGGNYDLIRDALVADGLAESDDAVVAYLPTASQFNATVLGFSPTEFFTLSGDLSATKANLKAIGFDALVLDTAFGAADASMQFNSDFAFDFDRSDGVSPGTTDFETVVAHEIGHVLGFESVVDTVDVFALLGLTTPLSPRTLDLFRFDANQIPLTNADFTAALRLLVPGFPDFFTFQDQFPAVFTDLDRVHPFSTGAFLGDGFQASHWKDDGSGIPSIGIMDPNLAPGQVMPISAADIRALDLIGWDYVPAAEAPPVVGEPGSGLLLAGGLLLMGSVRARRGSGALRRRPIDEHRSLEPASL